jgi:hypothetical protein
MHQKNSSKQHVLSRLTLRLKKKRTSDSHESQGSISKEEKAAHNETIQPLDTRPKETDALQESEAQGQTDRGRNVLDMHADANGPSGLLQEDPPANSSAKPAADRFRRWFDDVQLEDST